MKWTWIWVAANLNDYLCSWTWTRVWDWTSPHIDLDPGLDLVEHTHVQFAAPMRTPPPTHLLAIAIAAYSNNEGGCTHA